MKCMNVYKKKKIVLLVVSTTGTNTTGTQVAVARSHSHSTKFSPRALPGDHLRLPWQVLVKQYMWLLTSVHLDLPRLPPRNSTLDGR